MIGATLLGLALVGGTTSFEEVPAGPFTTLTTGVGRWSAEEGHALVDDAHARTGRQCLHLVGGTSRQVELAPDTSGADVSTIDFWAERWTRREPFEFRVSRFADGAWSEVYVGDEAVLVGGFLTHVRIPVHAPIERLRFTCTSPSGVLIDDLQVGRAVPMELVAFRALPVTLPCLVGRSGNPVTRLGLETTGSLDPLVVTGVEVELSGTLHARHLLGIEVVDAEGRRLGEVQAPARRLEFRGGLPLREGLQTLEVRVEVARDADLDQEVGASFTRIHLDGGRSFDPGRTLGPVAGQRLAVAVRDAGDDGAAVYRIPGLVTTRAGTLLAVYDVRWKGWADLPGDIDVGLSRSTDGGRTWAPMQRILDLGDDPAQRFDGVGDPAVLVDGRTGTIWVAALWSHGERGWNGSGPGLTPEETGQLVLTRSDDDGLTWSAPIPITAQVKRPEWSLLLQGPGRGICMADGTLVFPAQYRDAPEHGRTPHSTILTSQDRGATWHLGTGAKPDTTEAQVVELEDGVLMLNMRDNRGGARAVATTRDLGATWQEHPTSGKDLVDPVCNAALVRADRSTLLFCNPAVARAPRRRMTLKASPDLGRTWPASLSLLLDEGESAGYSSLTMIDANTVGVLYEGSRAQLVFQRVKLEDLLR